MSYKDGLTEAMTQLGKDDRILFLGQSVAFPGNAIYGTLTNVPDDKKIEMPVAEEMQMGICIGLALEGYIPVCIFPRMDFMLRALDQLVNHLDKIEGMSCGQFKPKVIIRTMIGSKKPLDGGVQHTQDYSFALQTMLTNVDKATLTEDPLIPIAYEGALNNDRSTILIEIGDMY